MNYLKILSRGLIFALIMAMTQGAAMAQIINPDNLNALVINFAPPFSAGQNLAGNLYNALLTTMQEKPADLAGRVNSAGAIWSVSQNLSGVQFALFFPGDNRTAIEVCKTLLRNLGAKIPTIRQPAQTSSFVRHLHSLCRFPVKDSAAEFRPISVFTCCQTSNAETLLGSETALLESLYNPDQSARTPEHYVVQDSPATVYEIFTWADFSLSSFLSARYTGEIFVQELGATASASYEILVTHYGLALALLVTGSEEELFVAREKVKAFLKTVHGEKNADGWANFAGRALQILEDDNRDFRKKSLFDSWVKHWNGDFVITRTIPGYVAPTVHTQGVSHPERWRHEFSYSHNSYPRFVACSISGGSDTADIAISFTANASVINALDESIKNDSASLFPLNLERQSLSRLVLSFHCPVDKISGNIARIRSRLTGDLLEKGVVKDFQNEIRTGISGACNIQPFELRGYLQQGWPTTEDSHAWRQPDASSLTQALMFASGDSEAVKRRWALATSTGKGKAIILSYLAAHDLMLKNFITH